MSLAMTSRPKHASTAHEVRMSLRRASEDCTPDFDAAEFCVDPVKASIARLSDEDIRGMSHFDLVDVTKISGVFSSREWSSYLRLMDLDELRLTAFLARRLCRQEINRAYQQRGRVVRYLQNSIFE